MKKKELNKFKLKKNTISKLSQVIGGVGRIQKDFTINPTNDPTARTLCFDCPPKTFKEF